MPEITRIGDVDSDGDVMVTGSPNVFANENEAAGDITIDPITAEFFIYAYSSYKPSDVSSYTHASHIIDDEGAPADSGGVVPYTNKQIYAAAAAKEENVNISTPPQMDPPVTIPARTPSASGSYNYDDIQAATHFDSNFMLSPSFSLGALTNQCRVSKYTIRNQVTNGRTYTEKEIVCNLRDLCYNILEPLRNMYPGMIINSGFRHNDGGKSQHERGQAADVAWRNTDTNADAAWTIAQAIANSNLPYDQFIFEQNNTIWFHLSYDRSKPTQRGMVLSMPRGQRKPTMGLQRAR